MASKINNTNQNNKQPDFGLINYVQRPQRKKLSRYKRKKQASFIEQISIDPQIIDS